MKVFSLPVYRGESVGQGCVRVCDGNGGFAVVNEVAAPFVVEAINNHDRLQQENAELKEILKSILAQAKSSAERRHIYEQDEFQWAVNRLNKLGAHRDK